MKRFLPLMFLLFVLSCKEDDNLSSYVNSTNIEFIILDENNVDLLNPENVNISDDLQIFYEENGQWIKYYESNLDYSKGYRIYKREDKYILTVYPKNSYKSNFTKSILKWKSFAPDTIINEYKQSPNSITNDKIYINGELVWTVNNASTNVITLEK